MRKELRITILKLVVGYIALVVICFLIDSEFEKDIAIMKSVVYSSGRLLLVGIILGLLIKTIDIKILKTKQKIIVVCLTLIIAVLPGCLYWMLLVNISSEYIDAAKYYLLLTGVFIGESCTTNR